MEVNKSSSQTMK